MLCQNATYNSNSRVMSSVSQSGTMYLPREVTEVPSDLINTYPHSKRVGCYLLGKTLGQGSFAKVKEGVHTLTGEKVAVKIVSKKKAKEDAYVIRNLRREGKLLQLARHANIIEIYEVMETENSYYLVTELCAGGNMMDYICKKKRLEEKEVRRFMRQMISAVDHLHRHGILHRDLKVENLLLDENRDIKIIDFGLSNMLKVSTNKDGQTQLQEYCITQCGSPAYAAPELLGHNKYGTKVDVWSTGVNMYAMLTGNLPFTVSPFNIKALHTKMINKEMNPMPENLSKAGCEFMLKLLAPDPEERITLADAMQHRWINEGYNKPLMPASFPNKIKSEDLNFNIMKHMTDKMSFTLKDAVSHIVNNQANTGALAVYTLLHRRLQKHSLEKKNRASFQSDKESVKTTSSTMIKMSLPPSRADSVKPLHATHPRSRSRQHQQNITVKPADVNQKPIDFTKPHQAELAVTDDEREKKDTEAPQKLEANVTAKNTININNTNNQNINNTLTPVGDKPRVGDDTTCTEGGAGEVGKRNKKAVEKLDKLLYGKDKDINIEDAEREDNAYKFQTIRTDGKNAEWLAKKIQEQTNNANKPNCKDSFSDTEKNHSNNNNNKSKRKTKLSILSNNVNTRVYTSPSRDSKASNLQNHLKNIYSRPLHAGKKKGNTEATSHQPTAKEKDGAKGQLPVMVGVNMASKPNDNRLGANVENHKKVEANEKVEDKVLTVEDRIMPKEEVKLPRVKLQRNRPVIKEKVRTTPYREKLHDVDTK